ncbi:unnamed protein product [Prunus brigantina]
MAIALIRGLILWLPQNDPRYLRPTCPVPQHAPIVVADLMDRHILGFTLNTLLSCILIKLIKVLAHTWNCFLVVDTLKFYILSSHVILRACMRNYKDLEILKCSISLDSSMLIEEMCSCIFLMCVLSMCSHYSLQRDHTGSLLDGSAHCF